MANSNVSANTPTVQIEFLPDGVTPTVSSKDIALRFQKKHKDVLRDIERFRSMVPKSFYERNFAPIEIDVLLPHSGGIRKDPAYLLTRDAFTLLAMGFTGKTAILWKLRYIEAFNALEARALSAACHTAASKAFALVPSEKKQIGKIARYKERGFTKAEIVKVTGLHARKVHFLLKTAAELGLGAHDERH